MPKHRHDPDLLALIGARIAEARRQRGWSQARLAEELGIQTVTLSRYEGGHKGPSITTIAAAAGALGVQAGDLVDASRELPGPDHDPDVEEAIRLLEGLSGERRDLALRLLRELAR